MNVQAVSGTEYVCVWDCVYACFKDSYSVTLAQTTEARKTKRKVFVLEKRELASLQAAELRVHFPISYQLDLKLFYFRATLLSSCAQTETHSTPTVC